MIFVGFVLFIFVRFFGFPSHGFVAIISNIFPYSHSQHVSEARQETFGSSFTEFSFFLWYLYFPFCYNKGATSLKRLHQSRMHGENVKITRCKKI